MRAETARSEGRSPRVLLVCSGLDHARRGYETFARECFAALRDTDELRLELVKGSGERAERERVAPTLRRDTRLAQMLGRRLAFRPFRLEALLFALALQPVIARRRPDVVYLSEWDTAQTLARIRTVAQQSFRVLLCNGGFAEEGFERLDHVQELTPAARQHVLARGADPKRHSVLPLGFDIPAGFTPALAEEREALRRRWGLPLAATVVTSVAALNRSHKRLDWLIEELAALPQPRPFLLLVGESDAETPSILALAAQRLGTEGHRALRVPPPEVRGLLRASDAFVLPSLNEAQGRAVVEAMAEGLPCLVHDSPVMRFALGEFGTLADLRRRGSLATMLAALPRAGEDLATRARRHAFVFERFSWESLRPRYVRLLREVATPSGVTQTGPEGDPGQRGRAAGRG